MPNFTSSRILRAARNAELYVGGGVLRDHARRCRSQCLPALPLLNQHPLHRGARLYRLHMVNLCGGRMALSHQDDDLGRCVLHDDPSAAQRGLAACVDLILIGANLWFCWLSWVLAAGGFVRKTPVLEIPYFWVNLAPLIAFGLMAIYSVGHLIQGVRHTAPYQPNSEHEATMYQDSSL